MDETNTFQTRSQWLLSARENAPFGLPQNDAESLSGPGLLPCRSTVPTI